VHDIVKRLWILIARQIHRAMGQKNGTAETMQECQLTGRASAFMAQRQLNSDISGLVFSMDRAMQLHALLGSYRDNVTVVSRPCDRYARPSPNEERIFSR
jgi:hypothetical protein